MSASTRSAGLFALRAVRWDEVEPGFRVGTLRGEYLGFIESTARGTFVAVDGFSTPVGRYYSLRKAQRALVEVGRVSKRGPVAPTELLGHRLATASGLVAATLMLTAGTTFLPV